MDDQTFDARVRALGNSANRRAVLGALAALAGMGAVDASAKRGKVRGSKTDDKVTICHYDKDADTYYKISVAKAAWSAHEKHGDYVLEGDCCSSGDCSGSAETCQEAACVASCAEPGQRSSYGQSCDPGSFECTPDGNILTAACEMGDGYTMLTTSINVNGCEADDYEITNCNGTLTCGGC